MIPFLNTNLLRSDMPVTYNYGSNLSADATHAVTQAIKQIADSSLYKDLTESVNTPVTFAGQNFSDPAAVGQYSTIKDTAVVSPYYKTASGELAVSAPADIVNTTIHEIIHANQVKAIGNSQLDVGKPGDPIPQTLQRGAPIPDRILKQLNDLNVNYNPYEAAAYLITEMRVGPHSRDPKLRKVINSDPEFFAKFFRDNASPAREPVKHYKGGPEWTPAEQAIFKLTGERPQVTPIVPQHPQTRSVK